MNLQTIIFMGRSGCGKGTQVEKVTNLIKEKDLRKVFHLESGNRFREFIKGNSLSARLSKEINDTGGLQPEFLSAWVWTTEIVENLTEDMHLLIDGTPRRLSEAKVLESAFDFYGRINVDIVYLNVSREWATKRMQSRGRNDDKDLEEITARLNWFDSDVVPVIDFYRMHRSHHFHEINGEQTVDAVFNDIVQSLGY